MEEKKKSILFKIILWLVRLFYIRMNVAGEENLPDEPSVIVSNHCKMNGPIACELYFPGQRYTWCAGEMMHLKQVPDYAYRDFWSGKPGYIRWFFRLSSYIIAPLSVVVFGNANTIPVYRDSRILSTFRTTIARLQQGANVVIFPEKDADYNHILCDFQEGFVDLARLYYKKTGRELNFVPMYIAPRLKMMYIGKPIQWNAEADAAREKQRICDYLKKEITEIACSLPRHKVVVYRNVSRKKQPYNIPE